MSSTLPPVLRVHPEISGMFADEMDLLTLTRWRAACRINYKHAVSSLRRSLTTRLGSFVTSPQKLVDIVTKHGGVFGGQLALSFILRDKPFLPTNVEIFASNYAFSKLCGAVLDEPTIRSRIEKQTYLTSTLFHALRRLVAETLVLHLSNGKTIYIHQSYTCSPVAPISRAPCTALSNYVTAYGFGCSHPLLTTSDRALLADQEIEYLSPIESESLNHLLAHKFSLAVSPTAWADFRRFELDENLQTVEQCWRERFICPNQGRYFGDRGSFVDFFNPLGDDEEECVNGNIAPFGPMVVWRLMSTFECDDGCAYLDEVLEQGVTSIPVLFKRDPYGELRDCISDRNMRSSSLYRSFGRPRSLSV